MDALRVEPGLRGQAPDDQEGAGAGEPAALRVEEELRSVAPVEVRAAPREVAPEGFDRLAAERDDALLVALPHAAHGAVLEVDAAALQPDRLAHAEPAAVEELDEGPVAQAAGRRAVGGVDQALDLAERERARQPLAPPRQVDVGRRVVAPQAQRDEMPVEGAGRGGRRAIELGACPRPRRSASQPSMSSGPAVVGARPR